MVSPGKAKLFLQIHHPHAIHEQKFRLHITGQDVGFTVPAAAHSRSENISRPILFPDVLGARHCFLLFPHYQERIADASLQAMISLYPRVVPFSEPHGDLIRKEALPVAPGSLRHGIQISLPVGEGSFFQIIRAEAASAHGAPVRKASRLPAVRTDPAHRAYLRPHHLIRGGKAVIAEAVVQAGEQREIPLIRQWQLPPFLRKLPPLRKSFCPAGEGNHLQLASGKGKPDEQMLPLLPGRDGISFPVIGIPENGIPFRMEAVFVPRLSAIDHVEVLALYKTVEHIFLCI